MTQDQFILLAFKVVETASVATILGFIVAYSRWAPWWKDQIGRTIVAKDLALVLVLIPSIVSIFLHFNRVNSRIAAWCDLIFFACVPVIMVWRTLVFWRIHKNPAAGGRNRKVKPGRKDAR